MFVLMRVPNANGSPTEGIKKYLVNVTEWMASTGFIFPRTVVELARFEKLYDGYQEDSTGFQIDPDVILGKKQRTAIISLSPETEIDEPKFRMAARKGDAAVPKHIMDKIKKNQDKRKQDDPGAAEEGT
jgi:hypothetical protein